MDSAAPRETPQQDRAAPRPTPFVAAVNKPVPQDRAAPRTEAGKELAYGSTADGIRRFGKGYTVLDYILAIEREAATAPALDRIDVERLALAQQRYDWPTGPHRSMEEYRLIASGHAAEYLRLTPPGDRDPEAVIPDGWYSECLHPNPNWSPDDPGYGFCPDCDEILTRSKAGVVVFHDAGAAVDRDRREARIASDTLMALRRSLLARSDVNWAEDDVTFDEIDHALALLAAPGQAGPTDD